MRVLISASTFPLRPDDGTPAFVLELATALAERCRVTVLAPGAPGAPARERWGEVDVRRFDYFRPRSWQRLAYGDGIDVNLRRSWLARLQPPGFLLAQVRATHALAESERIDLVNSHWIVPQGLSSALALGARRRAAHVVTLHGGDAYLLRRLPGGRRIARFVVARSDALLASSSAVREQLDAALGRESGAAIQPVGVALSRFGEAAALPDAEAPFPGGYLLYVGRLQEIKGVSDLLRALPGVRAKHPELGLLVVGYGEREASLRREAQDLGLSRAVRFAGRRGREFVASALRGCRAAVVPSRRLAGGRAEGMPAVLLEALAAGARVVATATGGIPDVLRHGENGWLCRDADPADLTAKLLAALADAGDAVPRNARATAERYDWARVADRYCEAFESARARAEPRLASR